MDFVSAGHFQGSRHQLGMNRAPPPTVADVSADQQGTSDEACGPEREENGTAFRQWVPPEWLGSQGSIGTAIGTAPPKFDYYSWTLMMSGGWEWGPPNGPALPPTAPLWDLGLDSSAPTWQHVIKPSFRIFFRLLSHYKLEGWRNLKNSNFKIEMKEEYFFLFICY